VKITKSQLKQIIKEEISGLTETYDRDIFGDEGQDLEPPEENAPEDAVPPAVALMEDLWDVVRGFYKLGRSDVALKLQKIAEMADEEHERLMPRGEGTPGLAMPQASSESAWELKRKLNLGKR